MRKKILYAFAVNIFVMFLMAVMFTTSEKTDDYVMKLILSGAMSGTPDAHLLYVNFFLGKTLEILTKFVPQVSWMEVSQIGTVFLSLTIFTIFMQDEEKPAQSWAAILPVIIFFGYEGYMKITFTKTAGIAMGVGMLLLCYAFLQKKTWKCYETVCGALLFLLGTMFRSKMLNAAILIFGGILLIHYFPEFWRNKGKARWKLILRPVLGAVLLFVLAKSVSSTGLFAYKLDKNWAAYKEYNKYKVELQDYGWPSYTQFREQYTNLGVTYNDFVMWETNRDYADVDRFTNPLLQKLISLKTDSLSKYPDSISSFLLRYPQDYFKTAVVLAFGLMMFMLIGTDHPKKWQALIYIAVLSIAMDFYLYANGRYGRTHVEIATWFISIMYLCYFIRLSKVSKDRVFAFGLASAMMFIYLINRDSKYINSSTFTTSTYTMSQSSARSVMDTITADKEHMYVLSNEEYYGLMLCYKTLEAIPAGAMDNIFVLSSFAYPSCQEVLSRYNKRNVFASLCDNDVYYVSSYEDDESNVKTILRYIREHYYPRAKVRVVRTIRGVTVYKFSTGNTLPIIHP